MRTKGLKSNSPSSCRIRAAQQNRREPKSRTLSTYFENRFVKNDKHITLKRMATWLGLTEKKLLAITVLGLEKLPKLKWLGCVPQGPGSDRAPGRFKFSWRFDRELPYMLAGSIYTGLGNDYNEAGKIALATAFEMIIRRTRLAGEQKSRFWG